MGHMDARIRLAEPSDAAAIQAIYAPYVENTPISFEVETPSIREMARRISETLELFPWLVCEVDSAVAGYAYASRHQARTAYQWSANVSVYLSPHFHRRGIGRALYTSLFRCLAVQGYYNLYAGITLPNPASVGLHEAMGFQKVGIYPAVGWKSGVWYDTSWWQLSLRTDRDASPAVPLTPKEAQVLPEWEAALNAGLPYLRPAS